MKPDLMYSRIGTNGNHWWVPCPPWVPQGKAFRDPAGKRWLPAKPENFIKWSLGAMDNNRIGNDAR